MRKALGASMAAVACCVAGAASAQEFFFVWRAAGLYGPYADDRLATPSDAEVMAAWPAAAAARKLSGNALAACKADVDGKLSNCRLMVARPGNAGFGEALLALAPKYRLKPAGAGGRPAGADVLITADWPVPDVAPSWRVEPKPGDFQTTLTDAAWRAQGPMFVVMNCLLGKLGTLYQCVVVYQDPPGKGLGAMALRFSDYLRFKPALRDGKPIAVGLTIPFNFQKIKRYPSPTEAAVPPPKN